MDTTLAPIRQLESSDVGRCVALAAERGWSPEQHKWSLLFGAGEVYGVEDPADGGLAAVVTLTPYGSTLAAVGMMVVAARHEGRGLGRRLMEHVIDRAGTALVTLYATQRGRPLYEKLGLQVIGVAQTLVGEWVPDTRVAPTTRSVTSADWAAIAEFDRSGFGADRTRVLDLLPTFADDVRVAEADGRLVGYAARWQNASTAMIGPVVAEDLATAERLVADLAGGELSAWVIAHGPVPGMTNSLMTAGGAPLPGDARRRYAPLTVATG
jgi:GNAT superfamily N-acetyltransferase